MSSLSLGLEIGKRGIIASQTVLNTIGHNVANAATEGYSKQVAYQTATRPYSTPAFNSAAGAGQVGTGVEVSSINRLRSAYLDAQYRTENSSAGYWASMQQTLSKIEVIVNEPSEDGLRSTLDAFWEAWQDLSKDPENESVRAVVAEQGQAVCDDFQHIYKQYTDLREDLNANVKIDTDTINSIGVQLQALNREIAIITASGREPNDLKDKRDLLIDQLSELVNVKVSDAENGMINVTIGGRNLVSGIEYYSVEVAADSEGMFTMVWSDTGTAVKITDGEVAALYDARDEVMVDRINNLNLLAKTVVMRTNEIHSRGYSLNNTTQEPDGTDFFTMPDGDLNDYGYWAKTMSVATAILNDPKNIAAALDPTYDSSGNVSNFGDGNNALAIAQLKQDINSGVIVYSDTVAVNNGDAVFYEINGSYSNTLIYNTGTYATFAEFLQAIADDIMAHITNISEINVSCDNGRLVFSSDDADFTGVTDLTVAGAAVGYEVLDMINTATTDDYWRSETAVVGVLSDNAISNSTNQETLVSELESQRQSVSGVSLDEEAADMVKYQHAYNAASRFITVIDEMLDKLINGTGIVGR